MRFLVDESTGPSVAQWLRQNGHDVVSVYEQARGSDDDAIIALAYAEKRKLITNDKDFGEKVYRDLKPHCGVVLLRMDDETARNKIVYLQRLFKARTDSLENKFVVITEKAIRTTRVPGRS